MNKQQFAEQLNGREYPFALTEAERAEAKASRLLVIYGASDDLMEFDGAWREEADVYNGDDVYFNAQGDFLDGSGLLVTAVWCEEMPDGRDPSWHYRTKLPHTQFEIMEDGQLYCVGIVIDLNKLEGDRA